MLRRARMRSIWSVIASVAVVAALFAFVPVAPARAAGSNLTLSKSGDATALVDAPISYTLKVHNGGTTSADREYNLSFRDVLPVGVTYLSTSGPKGLGDPQIITIGTAPATQQVLIWSNVSDLPAGADQTVAFQVNVDPAVYPVGSTVTNTGNVYAQADPRTIPKFDGSGNALVSSYTDSATSPAFTTKITALTIEKSENSPEHELMRGVHDDTAVYTLKVTNNPYKATDGNTVVDYLPAGLEFLGCGGVDNGDPTNVNTQEYGTRTLAGTPAPGGTCVSPAKVETVNLAAGDVPGLTAGVYTKVTWTLPDLAASGTWTTQYRAGIPQRANTMSFGGATPTPGSLKQAANLDNNTGADTREPASPVGTQDGEHGLTNLAQVTGTYTGAVAAPGEENVLDSDSVTVTAEDLAVQKSVSPTTFAQDGVATYTLHVETGEYADATGITITDVIPDGLCPLKAGSTTACATSGGSDFTATGAAVQSVTHNADNTWSVVFKPFDQSAQQTATITYQALMTTNYTGHGTAPTVSGDDYTNNVSLTGKTTTLGTVNAPDGGNVTIAGVGDLSSATIGSTGPSLHKTIMRQATPYACNSGTYTDNTTTPQSDDSLRFRVGDRVCFTVRVDFSSGNATKNPVVTDFLPSYVTYEAGSAVATGNNTVTGAAPSVDGSELTWTVGSAVGSDLFVPRGGVFEWRLSAVVTSAPNATPKPDITANLAKLIWTDTTGTVGFLRDQVDFSIGATPPVSIAKTHTGFATGVIGGDLVPYTITVTNQGTSANGNDVPISTIDVRDVLPAGIKCGAISADVPNDDGCTDDAINPSVLEWTLLGPIAPGASTTITYKMTIPTDPRVLTAYQNTAGVVSYDTATNLGTPITHYPANTDPSLTECGATPLPACDVPPAQDPDTVTVKNTGLTKTQATSISATNNNANTQAVIGEQLTYTVKATVPAHTTVYQGTISDPMPTGIELLSAAVDLDGTALPTAGATVAVNTKDDTGADGVTITLPATYTNSTAADQVFTIVATARVTTLTGNKQSVTRQNTATFVRKSAPTGGTNLAAQTASTTATVIEPSPTLTKSHTPTGKVSGGQTVTYSLVASDLTGRPSLYDAYVIDCVPAGLTSVTVTTVGATTDQKPGDSSDASNGCPTDTTRLHWSAGTVAAGSPRTLTYTAVVDPAAVGGQIYTNTATLSGSDLNDGSEQATAIERSSSATASDNVTVEGSTLVKSSSTPLVAVGDLATFTVTASVPASVNYYDATIVDTLPAGLDASKIVLKTSTCTYADTTDCTVSPAALTGSGQQVGWFLGDLTANAQARTITLTYTAPVKDLSGLKAGDSLTNSAVLGWDLTDKTDPTSVTTTPDQTAGPAAATDTVTEPQVTITKAVSQGQPAPGDTFTYTVTATNTNTGTTSDAHQVVVTDVVPTGVVVNTGSISDGGTIVGDDATTGGGTITWTLTTLAKNAAKALTYTAQLAAPTSSNALTNTATVTSYCSVAFSSGTCADAGGRTYTGPSATAQVKAALPHVKVAKTVVGGDLAYLGAQKTFTVTITSDGGSKAYQVGAVDVLPANWTYVTNSAQASVAGGAAAAAPPAISGQTLTWTNLGDLPSSGDTIVITYAATPDDPAAATTPGAGHTVDHTNTVSVTAQDKNGQTSDQSGTPYNGSPASATVHIDAADLQIVKSAVGTPVAGQDVSWKLTVTNNGPDPEVGPVTVTDPMPAALTSVAASGTGWTCGVSSSTVTCTRSDGLASGSSYPVITVTGHVPAATADGAHLDNVASVSGGTYDPDTTDNSDESDVQVTTLADMKIVKALSGGLTAGENATYTLDVTDNGPSVHRGKLTVTDAVPAGTTFVSASGANWTCSTPPVGGTGTITCDRSDTIAVGPTDQITVVVKVDSGRTADVVNTGTVASPAGSTTDPVTTNNDSTVTKTPGTSADLSIDKSRVDDADFVAGQTATYLLTVHNDGSSDAQAVVIADTLPAYLSYQDFTSISGGWSCGAAGQVVTCQLPSALATGADASVRIQVKVADDHRGNVVNTATVDSTTPDPQSSNNSDTDDLSDGSVNADLSIAKSHPAGNVVAGGANVTYTLRVTNHGPSKHNAADGAIQVVDDMPAGMTCVSVSGGSCPTTGTGSYAYAGDLAVGAGFDVTVVAHVAASAGPATLVNTATVTGPNDANPTNDTATDSTAVADQADIDLTKTVTGADPVRAGETTSFLLTAHNAGPSDADLVTVADTLPAGMSVVDISGTGWTCDPGTLTCTRATLAAGASASVTVDVRVAGGVADGTTLRNNATVSTATAGDDPANDDAHADVDVVAQADIQLTKAHVGGGSVLAGTDTSYTLDVHNAGPSDAQGPITVTDTLPTGMSYLSADGGWTCSAAGQVVTCTQPGPLLAGADASTLTMHVQVGADADVTAGAVNTADAAGTTDDPVPGNNDDDATVAIERGADVSIVKSHAGVGTIGDQVDFTLAVHNAGPSTARAVTVSDLLPTGLEYVSADGGAEWTCSYDDPSRTVTCDHTGPIAPDTDATDIQVVVAVHAAAYPSVVNVATVDTATTDTDPDDNTSADPLTVPSKADLGIVKKHTGTLVVGSTAHYTLTVTNDGPTEAAGTVTVTDVLPSGLGFVSATGDGWACATASGTVTCTGPGLATDATSAIDLAVTVGPEAYPAVTNVATVTAPDADPDPTNNTSTDPAPVTPTVKLSIAKSVAYQRGSIVGWDIAVTNGGPSATVDPLIVVDQLPGALSYDGAQGRGWACADVAQTVTCTRTASLAAGATSTVRVATTLQPGAGSSVRNVATVTGGAESSDQGHGRMAAATLEVPPTNGSTGNGLPNTGGPRWWLGPLGGLLVLAGGLLLWRRRRLD